jgi:hypothetical protein
MMASSYHDCRENDIHDKLPLQEKIARCVEGSDLLRKRREPWKRRSGGSAMVAAT